MDLFRFASLAADFCALRKPALSNRLILALNHLISVVQKYIVFKDGFRSTPLVSARKFVVA